MGQAQNINPLLDLFRHIDSDALKLAPQVKRKKYLQQVTSLRVDWERDHLPTRIRNFAEHLPSLAHLSIFVLPNIKQFFPHRCNDPYGMEKELERLDIHQDEGVQDVNFTLLLSLFPHRKGTFIHATCMARRNLTNPSFIGVDLTLITELSLVASGNDDWLPKALPQLTSCILLRLTCLSHWHAWHLLDRLVHLQLLPANVEVLHLYYGGVRRALPPSLKSVAEHLPRLRQVLIGSHYLADGLEEAEGALGKENVTIKRVEANGPFSGMLLSRVGR